MNQDIVQGKWKQIRGKTREWWGKLTDDDLDVINGSREQLIGKLQERYGYTRENAILEIDRRLKDFDRVPEEHHRV
jgi:uncharacterized protein YjbJ (UPF0337 family)